MTHQKNNNHPYHLNLEVAHDHHHKLILEHLKISNQLRGFGTMPFISNDYNTKLKNGKEMKKYLKAFESKIFELFEVEKQLEKAQQKIDQINGWINDYFEGEKMKNKDLNLVEIVEKAYDNFNQDLEAKDCSLSLKQKQLILAFIKYLV